jgi:ankyrin repeat protein
MSSPFRRTLPARPDLDQQKKLAKELVRGYRAGDPEATARMRAALPHKAELSLTDAQFVIAREYGFASWRALKSHIETLTAERRPPIEQFKQAVQRGDAATVRALAKQHAEVRATLNAPIFAFDAPALVFASDDHADVVDALLEAGADPNRRSDWWAGGFHPLHVVRGAAAERLLAAGAVPDACATANLDRTDLLAAMLADDPARVHERGGDGQTPLHFARSRAVVDLLLEAGADPDARDVDHRSTAAQWMIGDGADSPRWALARYLVERGATADIFLAATLGLTDRVRAMLEANPSLLQLRTSEGEYAAQPPSAQHIYQWTIGGHRSPLHAAARFGQRETLTVMERFASPAERLLVACHAGDGERARAILAEHAGLVGQLGPVERAALTDEAWEANAAAVELMLELGFDPAAISATAHNGGSALHCASWQGSAECVAAILRRPAGRALLEVNDLRFGTTPLHWCCHGSVNRGNPHGEYAAIARQLIAAGARVEPRMLEWEGSDEVMAVIDEALRGAHTSDDRLDLSHPPRT